LTRDDFIALARRIPEVQIVLEQQAARRPADEVVLPTLGVSVP
jgi:hypothetical protein